ncbi:MAG: hypothetical protein ACUVXA_06375 [Candidatus Jordarchaeum sp.]|uniref:hypothetical protein n=1 Tax=Candidatus Jordarchaeum sp. TaxID=2823881 RepID=UPI00404AF22B
MEGKNKYTPRYKGKTKLFRGKTKHILILLPAILLLTCFLALPLTESQVQAIAPLHPNSINSNDILSNGGISTNTKLTTTLNSPSSGGMSLTGSMTVTGDSILNGNLTLSNAQQVILGSPLFATGTMTLTGDKIELGAPCKSGGSITILGNSTSPAVNTANGTLHVGNKNTGSEVYFNITNYYQYVESYGGGYIGDWNNQSNDLIIPNSNTIKVHSGELHILGVDIPISFMGLPLTLDLEVWINHDWLNMTMNVPFYGLVHISINLWGDPSWSKANYNGEVNITQMAMNKEFPTITIWIIIIPIRVDLSQQILDMGNTPARYLEFGGGTVFESRGDWFAVGTSGGAGGVMVLNDTYVYMNSSQSITYKFLKNDTQAAITLWNSPSYPTARMYVSTTGQNVTGFGNSYSAVITNGGISTSGFSDIRNMNKITQGTLAFEGDMLLNGDITVQGDIGVSGYSKMLSPLIVSGSLNINDGTMTGDVELTLTDGYMITDGEMSIDGGKMSILQGIMEMNSTGIYIYDASDTSIIGSITFTGIMEITGSSSITGDIGISGYNYMEGNVDIRAPLLSLEGVMVTDGDMSITSGEIIIPSGSMVMNDTGSYIIGDTITVTGEVNFNGDATITGDIGISGYNYMQGYVNVAQLSLEGVMVTDGDMSISNGEISITDGNMVMNATGSFITSNNGIRVTGEVDFNGDATITGDIGISGYNYMQDLVTVQGDMNINNGLTTGTLTLTIDGTMETTGTMTIINGEISIPDGHMVMNATGSYIIGDTITVTGEQINSVGTTEVNGDITIRGDIGISGYNHMQGLISVEGYLNINNGLTAGTITLNIDGTMKTTGSMTITNGEINIPSGSMVMNVTSSYIIGDTITVTGEQINSVGTTEVNGDTTMQGDFEIGGESFIRGPVSISGSLNINGGTMKGTGTIVVSDGSMQTVGNMKISNGVITVLNGKIVMDSSGTYIGSETSITGDLVVAGTVTNSGLISMSGNFQILTPLIITGSMVTMGITSMGNLGAINGIVVITGTTIMSGATVISGDNNVIGSMTVTPLGVAINGIAGLTGVVHNTGGLPAMSASTVLEVYGGSMMGLPIPQVALMANPMALLALGILGFGTVMVAIRGVYYGIKERRTLIPKMRRTGEVLRNSGGRLGEAVKRFSSEVGKRIKRGE